MMSEQTAAGPGSTLRAEREALGVTLREVSETLNLSIDTIRSIEADRYERLPGPVFARGYIRAYARLLDLEPDPLLARSPRPDPDAGDGRAGSGPLTEWLRRRPGLLLAGALLLVAVSTTSTGVWLWPQLQPVELDDAAAGVGAASTDELAWGPETMRMASAPSGSAGVVEDITGDLPSFGAGEEAVPVVMPSPLADQSAPGAPLRLTTAGEDRLAMRFSADCWVQVRDADGTDLYGELSRAGDELELVGRGPLRILLGYAPGVQLTFNGEPVPLGPHTRNNVATLVLGQ